MEHSVQGYIKSLNTERLELFLEQHRGDEWKTVAVYIAEELQRRKKTATTNETQ